MYIVLFTIEVIFPLLMAGFFVGVILLLLMRNTGWRIPDRAIWKPWAWLNKFADKNYKRLETLCKAIWVRW